MLVGNLEDIVKNITSLHDLSEYLLLPEDFFRFQNTIRIAAGLDVREPPNPNLSNKIRLINAKNRYRER